MIGPIRVIPNLCSKPSRLCPATVKRALSSDADSHHKSSPDLFSSNVLLSESNRVVTQKRLSKRTALNEARKADPSAPRAAAVLVPLCVDRDGEVCLLYELRAKGLSSHAGQVCFPGGVRDEHEDRLETAAEAAVRETKEELGLDGAGIKLWGEMAPVGTRAGTGTRSKFH